MVAPHGERPHPSISPIAAGPPPLVDFDMKCMCEDTRPNQLNGDEGIAVHRCEEGIFECVAIIQYA